MAPTRRLQPCKSAPPAENHPPRPATQAPRGTEPPARSPSLRAPIASNADQPRESANASANRRRCEPSPPRQARVRERDEWAQSPAAQREPSPLQGSASRERRRQSPPVRAEPSTPSASPRAPAQIAPVRAEPPTGKRESASAVGHTFPVAKDASSPPMLSEPVDVTVSELPPSRAAASPRAEFAGVTRSAGRRLSDPAKKRRAADTARRTAQTATASPRARPAGGTQDHPPPPRAQRSLRAPRRPWAARCPSHAARPS